MKKGMLAALGAAMVAATALPSAVWAKPPPPAPPPPPPSCQLSDFSAPALACSGWFAGNLLNNGGVSAQQAALNSIGFTGTVVWSTVDATKINRQGVGTYDFAQLLNGITFIGIHKGRANGGTDYGAGFEGTAFYKINASNLDTIVFNLQGGSSAVLYQTGDVPGVPEPQTWLLMLLGFAGIGYGMRRKGAQTARLSAA